MKKVKKVSNTEILPIAYGELKFDTDFKVSNPKALFTLKKFSQSAAQVVSAPDEKRHLIGTLCYLRENDQVYPV